MEKIQALGLCRFSYPSAPGGFEDQDRSFDEVRARLYDPNRLALRFLWFEQVALPSMRAQTDPDFELVVLAGDRLPAVWRDRLEANARATPQIRPVFLEEGEVHRVACRIAMRAHRDPAADVVAEFRLDDDDAVADIFV